MKHLISLLVFMGFFCHLAFAAWEIFPLDPYANISTFNIDNYDPAIWKVTELPKGATVSGGGNTSPAAAGEEPKCEDDGLTPGFCQIEPDKTKCNIAIRIPSHPASPTNLQALLMTQC